MRIRLMFFACLAALSVSTQDTIRQHIDTLSLIDQVQYLDKELKSRFYSAPASMVSYIALYDSIIERHDIDTLRYAVYNFRGNSYFGQALYAPALEQYLEAQRILENSNNRKTLILLYNNIAACYRFTEETQRAIDYFKLALKEGKLLKDTATVARVNNNLGMQYLELERYEEARPFLDRAIAMYDDMGNDIYKGISLLTRANLHNATDAYKSAIADYNEAMILVPEEMVPIVHAASYAGIGAANRKMRRYSIAERYLKTSLVKAEKINHVEQIKESNRELSELYDAQGYCTKSMFHYKEYIAAKDSLFTAEQYQLLADANSKYEAEKKTQEIALLTEKDKSSSLQLKAAQRGNILLGGGVGMFGLLSLGMYYFWRKIKAKNKIISQGLQEKEILLKEIHHRVKNNLQFISALLGLQTDHVSDPTALEALQEGQDRVQSMALIHQNLYQKDTLTSVDMKEYFIKLTEGLFDSYNIRNEEISLELDIEDINLDVDSVIPIGLIVNELVSNSLKYAFVDMDKGDIKVELKEVNEKLLLKVSDSGKGMKDEVKTKLGESLGYKLVNALTQQLQGTLHIENNPGAVVTLEIVKYDKAAFSN